MPTHDEDVVKLGEFADSIIHVVDVIRHRVTDGKPLPMFMMRDLDMLFKRIDEDLWEKHEFMLEALEDYE